MTNLSRIFRFARVSSRYALVAAIPAALTLVPRAASAQQWLADRKYSEGAGIRVGNLELHPGIGAEVGYDSNFFQRTFRDGFVNGAPGAPVVGAGVLRITPSLTLSTLTSPRLDDANGPVVQPSPIAFRLGAAATYREFIGSQAIRDQRNIGGDLTARMDVFQARPLGFAVFGGYSRIIQPQVTGDVASSFNRDNVSAGAEVVATPGSGTLDMRLGYQFNAQIFEQASGTPFDMLTHEVSVRDRWKFRPRTALFSDTTLRFISYPAANRTSVYLNESTPLRTRFGVTGLVTDRLSLLLAAGYGASFFKDPAAVSSQQYDSINGQAEATIFLTQNPASPEPGQMSFSLSTLTFGYARDFQNSLLGNYYVSNKGYLKLDYFFGGKFVMSLAGAFEGLSYPSLFIRDAAGNPVAAKGPSGQPIGDFTNFRVGGTVFGEYRLTNAFALNATVDYTQLISDTAVPNEVAQSPVVGGGAAKGNTFYDLAWRRTQAFLGARYFF